MMEFIELVKQFGPMGVLIWYFWYQNTKTALVIQRNTEVMSQVLAYLSILQQRQAQQDQERSALKEAA